MSPARIGAVVAKETREVLRDPMTLFISGLMPVVMLFLFGYAISLDVDDLAVGVLDRDRHPVSRDLVRHLDASPSFVVARHFDGAGQMGAALGSGEVDLAVVIPRRFHAHVAAGESPIVQVLVDGTYSPTASAAVSYARAALAAFPEPRPAAIELQTRFWYNPALTSVTYVVPGLYAAVLLAFPPLLTALAITREKESGTIEQIYASPLSAGEFIAGKLIPYAVIAFLQMVLVLALGFAWFGVPMAGSPVFLLATGLIYALCTVGIGLLVSTITRSQLVAMLLALVVTLMPSLLFSGMLFPITAMPYVLQLYTGVFPGRYFVDISRGVALKGAGPVELWANLAILAAYTAAVFLLAARSLRKKVA